MPQVGTHFKMFKFELNNRRRVDRFKQRNIRRLMKFMKTVGMTQEWGSLHWKPFVTLF